MSATKMKAVVQTSGSHLRGASRFGPNGLKLEKETTHDLV